MKLSKYIKQLQKILETDGDSDVYYSIDDEGNAYFPVSFQPSSGSVYGNEFYSKDETTPKGAKKAVVIN